MSNSLSFSSPSAPLTLAEALVRARTLCVDLFGPMQPDAVARFGAAFHELLFACPPVGKDGLGALGMPTAGGEIIPSEVKVLLMRCLAQSPEVRPTHLSEVAEALHPYLPEEKGLSKRARRPWFDFGNATRSMARLATHSMLP